MVCLCFCIVPGSYAFGSLLATSSEPVADHATCEVPRETGAVYSVRSKATSLAELVTAGESKRIRDGKYECDDCFMLALHSTRIPQLE
jgi:hypothetical protein